MIKITRSNELPDKVRQQIENTVKSEFSHISFVQEISWSKPDWTIIYTKNNELLSFYNIIIRAVRFDDKTQIIAGVNNVITLPAHRGNGHSSKLLRSTTNFLFDDLQVDYGLLLCADELVSFYRRLGWYEVHSDVFFQQPTDQLKQWTANTMLLANGEKGKVNPQKINLCGLPW